MSRPLPAPPLAGPPRSATFFDTERADLTKRVQTQTTTRYDIALAQVRRKLGRDAPRSLCVIDLSGPAPPVLAGWEVDRRVAVASIAKLAVLYAAFQLRDDLRAVADTSGARDFANLTAALRRAWRTAPDPAIKELGKLDDSALPQLSRIFDTGAFDSGTHSYPEFQSSYGDSARQGRYDNFYNGDLNALSTHNCPLLEPHDKDKDREREKQAAYRACYKQRYERVLADVQFNELLHLTARWSDDEAATLCVSMLGLPFIQAVLRHRGLYNERTGGLWLGGGYRGLYTTAFRALGKEEGKPVKQPDDTDGTSTQAGTARSLAIMVAALMRRDLLVSGQDLMTAMLDFSATSLPRSSPNNTALFARVTWPSPQLYLSKIGLLGTWYSEATYLLATGQPTVNSFVTVALQATSSERLAACGTLVYETITELNASSGVPR